jgi:hypothetical protein
MLHGRCDAGDTPGPSARGHPAQQGQRTWIVKWAWSGRLRLDVWFDDSAWIAVGLRAVATADGAARVIDIDANGRSPQRHRRRTDSSLYGGGERHRVPLGRSRADRRTSHPLPAAFGIGFPDGALLVFRAAGHAPPGTAARRGHGRQGQTRAPRRHGPPGRHSADRQALQHRPHQDRGGGASPQPSREAGGLATALPLAARILLSRGRPGVPRPRRLRTPA